MRSTRTKYKRGFTKKANKNNARGLYYDPIINRISDEKISIHSIYFGSILEYECYSLLCKEFGVNNIKIHEKVVLIPKGKKNDEISWKIDFILYIYNLNKYVYFETKGIETEDYKLKYNLFKYRYPEKEIHIIKSTNDLRFIIDVLNFEISLF